MHNNSNNNNTDYVLFGEVMKLTVILVYYLVVWLNHLLFYQ